MAVHTGSEGTIKVGANAIGELRSYSLTEEAETIEKSAMGERPPLADEEAALNLNMNVDVLYKLCEFRS